MDRRVKPGDDEMAWIPMGVDTLLAAGQRDAGARRPRRDAGGRPTGRRLLSRQDRQRADRGRRRRRVRPAGAAGRETHRPPHPGQSQCRAAEHDRRERPQDDQLPLPPGAARRHLYRHEPERLPGGAGGRPARHPVRRHEVRLARHHRPRGRDHDGVARDRRQIDRGRAPARDRRRATSRGAITYFYAAMMNEFLGTKFKIVTGYNGGNEINLAMERGEVEARNNTWSSWKVTKPAWLKDRKITVIAQAGPRAPNLDAPSVEDLARNADDRRVIELVVSGTQLGRPLFITPGVPEERVKALRAAFDATMKDPEFLAEATSMNFEVAPVGGEALQKIVAKVVGTPKDLAARARHLLE